MLTAPSLARFPVSRGNVNLLSCAMLALPAELSVVCRLSLFAVRRGGGLIVPHVHVLGLIHPEICRMEREREREVPKSGHMYAPQWKMEAKESVRADGIRFQTRGQWPYRPASKERTMTNRPMIPHNFNFLGIDM